MKCDAECIFAMVVIFSYLKIKKTVLDTLRRIFSSWYMQEPYIRWIHFKIAMYFRYHGVYRRVELLAFFFHTKEILFVYSPVVSVRKEMTSWVKDSGRLESFFGLDVSEKEVRGTVTKYVSGASLRLH